VKLWKELHTNSIVDIRAAKLQKTALRGILEVSTGKLIKQKKIISLLDNSPLRNLIRREIDFSRIHKNIQDGHLESLTVTAVNYTDGKNTIFFEAAKKVKPWLRERRKVIQTTITEDHIMASTALPLYFPPHKIGDDFFADGNIRNSTPLSPPIRLGAEKLLVIPVSQGNQVENGAKTFDLTLGRILSVLLDALLLDATDFDFERLSRINETLSFVPPGSKTELRNIDVCMIRPSKDLSEIAFECASEIPKTLRFFLEGLGSPEQAGALISTLLFESGFTTRLTDLGYQDAMKARDRIVQFYS
jgi:NTE family protein